MPVVKETRVLPKTNAEAIELANEVVRLEAAIKELKETMKAYVEVNGPIETNDVVWDFTVSESWKFTAVQMKEVAQNIAMDGKDPWEFMGLSAPNLKKLEWDESFLSKLGKKTETKRFTSRKKN